jgi:ABC-type branched-subunit amino acid transport system substrate-binding protein
MAIKAGVWIDHRQAIVVLVTDAGNETKKIPSDIGRSGRPAGSSKSKEKRYTPSDFVAEDKVERKLDSQLKTYYDEVIACVRGAEAILIIGPGEAKGQFLKRLKNEKIRGRIVELETSDKMTDRQIAAKVGEHFATTAANEPVTPQNTPKATSRQRTKKSGK